MQVHFIAIGGAAMHNLALALHSKGLEVTGSDDEINEPSRSRLAKAGLLPNEMGWFPDRIHKGLDAVILGMHARIDNPELLRAQELGLPVYSYPEYVYEQSKDKKRLVIGGSHGKTTITSMVMHVLKSQGIDFDYLVGSQIAGFDTMVRLSNTAKLIVLEGDEYLASPIDRRPKFHLYHADVALISGIAWDHINVFPVYDQYVEQFRIFANQIPEGGTLIYCANDTEVNNVANQAPAYLKKIPYDVPAHRIEQGISVLETIYGDVALEVFGRHNLVNLEGARYLCNEAGVSDEKFYQAIASFKGAARRLERVAASDQVVIFKDFAHSPSKLKATTASVKEQFPDKKLFACMELHTFSSLNAAFLEQYAGSMDEADEAIVYFNPQTIAHKKLEPISVEQVKQHFARPDLQVYTDSDALKKMLQQRHWKNEVLLLMSSGTFDGIDLNKLAAEIAGI